MQRRVVRKMGFARAAPEIRGAWEPAQSLQDAPRKFQPTALLVLKNRRVQNLSSREKVDPAQIEVWLGKNGIQNLIKDFFVHAEWRWAAPHAHRSSFSLTGGLDAKRHLLAPARPPTTRRRARCHSSR